MRWRSTSAHGRPTDRGRSVCLPAYLTALPELRVPRSAASTREYRRRLHRYATPGTSGYISAKVFGDPLSRVVLGTPVSAWRRVPFQSGPMGGFAAAVRCPQGKDVLVIGGGDTGCDCIGASSHACALLQRSACCSAARDNTACLSVAAQRSTAHVASGCHWSITARRRVTARHAADIESP